MKNDNRPVIDRPDFDRWGEHDKDEWTWLTSKEKATCLAYKMFLNSNKKIPSLILSEINDIHERNPGFHVGFIPGETKKIEQINFQTMDFSGYLGEGQL